MYFHQYVVVVALDLEDALEQFLSPNTTGSLWDLSSCSITGSIRDGPYWTSKQLRTDRANEYISSVQGAEICLNRVLFTF